MCNKYINLCNWFAWIDVFGEDIIHLNTQFLCWAMFMWSPKHPTSKNQRVLCKSRQANHFIIRLLHQHIRIPSECRLLISLCLLSSWQFWTLHWFFFQFFITSTIQSIYYLTFFKSFLYYRPKCQTQANSLNLIHQ